MNTINVLILTENKERFSGEYSEELCLRFNGTGVGSVCQGDGSSDTNVCHRDRLRSYEMAVVDRNVSRSEAEALLTEVRAHTVFYPEDFEPDETTRRFIESRAGKRLALDDLKNHIRGHGRDYYAEPYGEKMSLADISISPDFTGKIKWLGGCGVELEGEFGADHEAGSEAAGAEPVADHEAGSEAGPEPDADCVKGFNDAGRFAQLAFWRCNIPIEPRQTLEFWLEYKKEGAVDILLEVRKITAGSAADITLTKTYTEEELQKPVCLENDGSAGVLSFSVKARGRGRLTVTALHDRHSRRGIGRFLPGGERYVTSAREEVFAYFDPGDLRPPLAVYFSGYKTREGFEGYRMMRKAGCPFLLIAEQRLEGGGFYIGSAEFEDLITGVIQKYMDRLSFGPEQLILSGISMGSTAALYYGCRLAPRAVIIGKPLICLGDMAENEKLTRPGGFPTSLDLLLSRAGGMGGEEIEKLNERIRSRMRGASLRGTKIAAAYMIEDDYDKNGYSAILEDLGPSGAQITGKGLHGRHNDDTGGITAWFRSRLSRILREDFDRQNCRVKLYYS